MDTAERTGSAVIPASATAGTLLSTWLGVDADGTVTVRCGKVELGQGILTALAQIAAEELDVALTRIRMVATGTDHSPDEGLTAGSLSVQLSGAAIRQACAQARALFLAAAAHQLGVDPEVLSISDGVISAAGNAAAGAACTSYWQLADRVDLRRPVSGTARPKSPAGYRLVGASAGRIDLPDKVTGRPRFIHDLAPAGMLYGRVVRPPARAATLTEVDTGPAERLPGVVAVVRDGDFLAVVAEREEVALSAAGLLRAGARWHCPQELPEQDGLADFLTAARAETTVLSEFPAPPEPSTPPGSPAPPEPSTPPGSPAPPEPSTPPGAAGVGGHAAPGGAAPAGGRQAPTGDIRTVTATYLRPYLAHASIAPSCALAVHTAEQLSVYSHSQGVHLLRRELALALGRPVEQIRVQHVEGAGCYGHNGADDVALDAALLARAVPGRPVQVVWSRADELAWDPYGPAAVVRIRAGVDTTGAVLGWHQEIWGNGHTSRPGSSPPVALLAAGHLAGAPPAPVAADLPMARGGGAGRNAVPGYDVGSYRVTSHRLLEMPLRTSALRALGAHANIFAIESMMDELAELAGVDPVEYRLRHLTDPRGRAVLNAAARRAGWPGPASGDDIEGLGRGVGYARYKNSGAYCAVVAEVVAEHDVRVRRLTVAVDVGLVVNPDGLVNQVEGGAVQSTSWALKEQVTFDRQRVTSDSWETYPILRFSEVPAVDVVVLDRPDEPSMGAGEAAQGPVTAAIANAVAAAVGVRVRRLPLTPENIVAAMGD